MSILQIQNLSVTFKTNQGPVNAVQNLSLTLHKGETLGIVGESGSGKTQTFMAVLDLLDAKATVQGLMTFQGEDLTTLSAENRRALRGAKIATIFQDPMTALNPYRTIGSQMTEMLEIHKQMSPLSAKEKAIELLHTVKIPDPEACMKKYSFELSGGMQQRVIIAMAISCDPQLIIADEPTTALDVTLQAEILTLLVTLQKAHHISLVLITHDLSVVSMYCDRVAVMYGGEIVEEAPTKNLFKAPQHPYTQALFNSVPYAHSTLRTLKPLAGHPPLPHETITGCRFAPRCPHVHEQCLTQAPTLSPVAAGWCKACFLPTQVL